MEIEELKIRYPSGFEQAVHLTKEELEQHIRLMAALKMFELGKISSGKAAQLAGMSRVEFLETCGRYRVSVFNYPPEEIERELKKDLETVRRLTSK
jgi:predicted HTH domain antitoxin